MFIPGETITHQFYIPFIAADVLKILVTYKQDDRVILTKTVYSNQILTVASGEQSTFTVTLTQQESLLFKNDSDFKIQLNVIFNSLARCASVEMDGSNGVQQYRKVVTSNE